MTDRILIERLRTKLDRIPDSDAVTLDKADLRALLDAHRDITDGVTILTAHLAGVEAELWEKRGDDYLLGKHDGVQHALNHVKRLSPGLRDGENNAD